MEVVIICSTFDEPSKKHTKSFFGHGDGCFLFFFLLAGQLPLPLWQPVYYIRAPVKAKACCHQIRRASRFFSQDLASISHAFNVILRLVHCEICAEIIDRNPEPAARVWPCLASLTWHRQFSGADLLPPNVTIRCPKHSSASSTDDDTDSETRKTYRNPPRPASQVAFRTLGYMHR